MRRDGEVEGYVLTAAKATDKATLVAQGYIVAAAYGLAHLFLFCLHILQYIR